MGDTGRPRSKGLNLLRTPVGELIEVEPIRVRTALPAEVWLLELQVYDGRSLTSKVFATLEGAKKAARGAKWQGNPEGGYLEGVGTNDGGTFYVLTRLEVGP